VAIYRVGQDLELKISVPMRILRAFAVEDTMYYIVLIKGSKIKNFNRTPLYGTFRHDDSDGIIPPEVSKMADEIVARENLLENL
jgi:hypothetical protein